MPVILAMLGAGEFFCLPVMAVGVFTSGLKVIDVGTDVNILHIFNLVKGVFFIHPGTEQTEGLLVAVHCLGTQLAGVAIVHVQGDDSFKFHVKTASFRLHILQRSLRQSASGNKQKNAAVIYECLQDQGSKCTTIFMGFIEFSIPQTT